MLTGLWMISRAMPHGNILTQWITSFLYIITVMTHESLSMLNHRHPNICSTAYSGYQFKSWNSAFILVTDGFSSQKARDAENVMMYPWNCVLDYMYCQYQLCMAIMVWACNIDNHNIDNSTMQCVVWVKKKGIPSMELGWTSALDVMSMMWSSLLINSTFHSFGRMHLSIMFGLE